jgi:hypothetical protein
VPSRRSEAICNSSAVPILSSSLLVHAVIERPRLLNIQFPAAQPFHRVRVAMVKEATGFCV